MKELVTKRQVTKRQVAKRLSFLTCIALSAAIFIASGTFALAQPVATAVETPPQDPVVTPETREVIEGALAWLASKQNADGSWDYNGANKAAITAYVLHAFLSAGHLPGEGRFASETSRALELLISRSRADGYLGADGGNMYGHGIATMVLGEIYGQSTDPRLKDVVSRALQVIVRSQSQRGGWRYQPEPVDDDVSVTVLQVVALRVGRNAGFAVPQATIDRAIVYIRSCQDKDSGGFKYRPEQRDVGFARSAAAIYSLQVCGVYDDPAVRAGQAYIEKNFAQGKGPRVQWWTYGQFYAAPAMYMIGDDAWRNWYAGISELLLSKVNREGDLAYWRSLDEREAVNDVYSTAVYVSILSVPLGALPTYQR